MKKIKIGICTAILFGSLILNACSVHAAGKSQPSSLTARETAERVMESLKAADLEQFNRYTDNYVRTYYNWIGVPVESEYRVFNELLQPGIRIGKWKKKYDFHRQLSEKMLEHLAWEIKDVEEDGNQAKIAMEITNIDMSDVVGNYEIYLWENIMDSGWTGIGQMIRDLTNIADDGVLLSLIEACGEDDTCTLAVTVTAYQKNGAWAVHLDDEFINAFMGNIDREGYAEYAGEIEQKIGELEERQNEKLDEWEKEFTNRIERWADGLSAY